MEAICGRTRRRRRGGACHGRSEVWVLVLVGLEIYRELWGELSEHEGNVRVCPR